MSGTRRSLRQIPCALHTACGCGMAMFTVYSGVMAKRVSDHSHEAAGMATPGREHPTRANARDKNRSGPRHRCTDAPEEVRRTPPTRPDTEAFVCIHCHASIGPTVSGGRHRNHCPRCLYSRHVDDARPGDRASACQGAMAPIGRFERANGEPVIVHRCLRCHFERHNRIAADDNWERYQALPLIAPRTGAIIGQVI